MRYLSISGFSIWKDTQDNTVYTLFYFILFYFLYIVVFHIVVLCSVHQWHQGNFLYVQTYLANKRILILILILTMSYSFLHIPTIISV